MRLLLTVFMTGLLATAAVACGAAPAAEPSPPASPPAQLTLADDQRTVALHVGDTLEVALQAQPGFSDWSHPTSTNPAVLAPQVDPRAAAVRGMSLAAFRAASRGRADIESASGATCSPGVACPALARAWQVHVVVS